MTKSISAALLFALVMVAGPASAATFSINVTFSDGGVGSGTFSTDSTFTVLTAWNFTLAQSPNDHNFTSTSPGGNASLQTGPPTNGCPSADAQELTFARTPFTAYTTLCLSTMLSSAGATIDLANSVSCDNGDTCATGVSGSIVGAKAQIGYSANLSAGDSFINLTNAGTLNGFDPAGDICANVYVFAEDQQLIACCTCPLTPNHLKTLSAQNDLINNTLTPGVPIGITTMLVASSGACDAASPGPLVQGLKAWGTTLHAVPGGGFGVTEVPLEDVTLSDSELSKLTSYCGFIKANGTGYGICGPCAQGAAGAAKQ